MITIVHDYLNDFLNEPNTPKTTRNEFTLYSCHIR